MHDWHNRGAWEKCYSLIDPKLRNEGKVQLQPYADRLREFRSIYGSITPWYTRISLHLNASSNKHDARPFAYVYVIWKDHANQFHMFRERWVRHSGQWFTRVVGLVTNQRDVERSWR